MQLKTLVLIVYACYLALLSLATFFAYGIDKSKAKRGAWRIPEKVLLLMSFLGGALGGTFGMRKFRHKTTGEHWYFTAVNVLGLIIHLALLVCVAFVFNFPNVTIG